MRVIICVPFHQVLVMGSAVGVIDSYLFMYLEDLGASETLMGLTLTFTCIGASAQHLRNCIQIKKLSDACLCYVLSKMAAD